MLIIRAKALIASAGREEARYVYLATVLSAEPRGERKARLSTSNQNGRSNRRSKVDDERATVDDANDSP